MDLPLFQEAATSMEKRVFQHVIVFFFFKQKTAYEIVPCDWSSDVCLPISSYWDAYKSGDQSMLSFLRGLVDDLNLHGRSGYGKLWNDPEYHSLRLGLNVYEQTIESITFYKSIAFVKKKRAGEID